MGAIRDLARYAWRRYVTDGVPATGDNEPSKTDIFPVFDEIDARVELLEEGQTQGAFAFASFALLDAFTPPGGADADNTLGIVQGDPGGASIDGRYTYDHGTTSWTRLGPLFEGLATNLWHDPCWRKYAAGLEYIGDYPLAGENGVNVQAIAGGPFNTHYMFVGAGSQSHTHSMDWSLLHVKFGENLYCGVYASAAETIQFTVQCRDAAGVLVGSAVSASHDFTNGVPATENTGFVFLTLPVDSDMVADGAKLQISSFTAGTPSADHSKNFGYWVSKEPLDATLIDTSGADFLAFKSAFETASPLAFKHGVMFGDSFTESDGTGFGMPKMIADATGSTIINVGIGGTVLSTHPDSDYDKLGGSALIAAAVAGVWTDQDAAVAALAPGDDNSAALARLKAVDFDDVDFVILQYGTNDWANDVALGTTGDSTRATFLGAINKALTDLLTEWPHLRVFMLAPIWRNSTGDSDTTNNGNGDSLPDDFVDGMIERGRAHKMPVWDGYRLSGFSALTQAELMADGTHPDVADLGEQRYAASVASFLKSVY